mgnify:CR=1 FL=1
MSTTRETISKRLRFLRLGLKLSLHETAQMTGLSAARISNWEQGVRQPKYEQIEILAKAYKTRPDYIVGWIDAQELSNIESFKPVCSNSTLINGNALDIPTATNITAYHASYLKRRYLEQKNLISIIVNDDSSAGDIKKNDELLIDTSNKNIESNDIFAIYSNNNVWIRNIRPKLNDTTFVMSSGDKENYPDETLTKDEIEQIIVIGRVARVSRDR